MNLMTELLYTNLLIVIPTLIFPLTFSKTSLQPKVSRGSPFAMEKRKISESPFLPVSLSFQYSSSHCHFNLINSVPFPRSTLISSPSWRFPFSSFREYFFPFVNAALLLPLVSKLLHSTVPTIFTYLFCFTRKKHVLSKGWDDFVLLVYPHSV